MFVNFKITLLRRDGADEAMDGDVWVMSEELVAPPSECSDTQPIGDHLTNLLSR